MDGKDGFVMILEFFKNLFFGDSKYFCLIAFGLFTFGIAFVSSILIWLFYGFRIDRYLRTNHFVEWNKRKPLFKTKVSSAVEYKRSLNDPAVRKISNTGDKYGKRCFLIWLILFLLVASAVIIIDIFGK